MTTYKVLGEAPNIQLTRFDEKGKATSARPASPEELEMYNKVIALEAEREEQAHRLTQLRSRLSAALVYAPDLAEIPHSDRSMWLTDRMTADLAMMAKQERDRV